jgi:O-acetyl-ADP-ribose deacetylase (regulator of RNase III)
MKSRYTVLASYRRAVDFLPDIILVQGSLLDFATTKSNDIGCIVNAANESCIGGGGIDGAIAGAGGHALAEDRLRLPILDAPDVTATNQLDRNSGDFAVTEKEITTQQQNDSMRCRTGSAVMTGPGNYGKIHVPFVIHAVGPNFGNYSGSDVQQLEEGLTLLRSTYQSALDLAASSSNPINNVAFCLLSAGFFRGTVPLETVLFHGLSAVHEWRPPSPPLSNPTLSETDENDKANSATGLSRIFVFAYSERECTTLLRVSQQVFNNRS